MGHLMFDYLLKFTDEAEAQAQLAPLGFYRPAEGDEPGAWDLSRMVAPIVVTMLDLSQPSGWWCAIGLAERREDLDALAQAVIDRDGQGDKLSDYVVATTWPTANIDLVAQISPAFAGSTYPFPGLPVTPEPDPAA